jgi:uncharacterized protein YbjQ (UPF0145 family)
MVVAHSRGDCRRMHYPTAKPVCRTSRKARELCRETTLDSVLAGAAHGAYSSLQPQRVERRMLVVTTDTIEGRPVKKTLGLVSGEAILGANIFRDFFAGIRDIVGGRSAAYEEELRKAKDIAITEMRQQAAEMGANAVVGVDLDYENITVGQTGGMLMVSASGTAVVV